MTLFCAIDVTMGVLTIFFEIVMLKPVTGPKFMRKYWFLAILGFPHFFIQNLTNWPDLRYSRNLTENDAKCAGNCCKAQLYLYFAVLDLNHHSKVITTGKIRFWKVGVVTTPMGNRVPKKAWATKGYVIWSIRCFFWNSVKRWRQLYQIKTAVADLGKILVRVPSDFRTKNSPFWGTFFKVFELLICMST